MAYGAGTSAAEFSDKKDSEYRDTDLHCLFDSVVGRVALADRDPSIACTWHARMFFDRPDFDLEPAVPGTFAIAPTKAMVEPLGLDYANTTPMIFGTAPAFEEILASTEKIEQVINTGTH